MNLSFMSIDKLSKLKAQIDVALASKLAEERQSLEGQLSKLSRMAGTGSWAKGQSGGSRGKVAPKYRNPANPSETWAGRGLKPRWLAAAPKSGKKLEHFAIATSAKRAPTKKSGFRGRRAKASAKK